MSKKTVVLALPVLLLLIGLFLVFGVENSGPDPELRAVLEMGSPFPGYPEAQPELMSEAAALFDFETETLLFTKNGDRRIPPASMTKLMTLHLVYRAIDSGLISRHQEVVIGESGDFHNQPRGSSLMFLEAGQRVTVLDLMRGLAVPSGNDAAVVLAELVSGDVPSFVEEMNREVARLGLEDMRFADPSGLSEHNSVSAESFGRFCIVYIKTHPGALTELHSLYSFTYPPEEAGQEEAGQEEVIQEEAAPLEAAPGTVVSTYGPITQENYNILVDRYPWVDGLKTGYIDESGYNIALTASVNGRRVVAVLLGGPGENGREGALTRAIDGVNLLSYGFYGFRRVDPRVMINRPVRVWKGARDLVRAGAVDLPVMVLPVEAALNLRIEYEFDLPLIAPVRKGQLVGSGSLFGGDELLQRYTIEAAEEIGIGAWGKRMTDSMKLYSLRVFSRLQ